MAISKSLIASLLISLIIYSLVQAHDHEIMNDSVIGGSLLQKIDCGGACSERCELSSRQNLCKRACGTCCQRCNCVPPGTSGNEDLCPCYANMTTHGGKHKCP